MLTIKIKFNQALHCIAFLLPFLSALENDKLVFDHDFITVIVNLTVNFIDEVLNLKIFGVGHPNCTRKYNYCDMIGTRFSQAVGRSDAIGRSEQSEQIH